MALPAPAPVITPVAEPTPATPTLLLVHVPPVGDEPRVDDDPTQIVAGPAIVEGSGFIVTEVVPLIVLVQPVSDVAITE